MGVPCVRVPTTEGEATRTVLADRDLIDREREITVESGDLYIPVVDPARVPAEYEVVERDVPVRETQTTPADLLGFEPSYERLGDVAARRCLDQPGHPRQSGQELRLDGVSFRRRETVRPVERRERFLDHVGVDRGDGFAAIDR
jgi:tRNA G37 N-methylase Trm5